MGCSATKSQKKITEPPSQQTLITQPKLTQENQQEIQDQSHVVIPKSMSKNVPLFIQPKSCRRTSDNLVRFKTDADSKENLLQITKNPIYLRRASSKTQADQRDDVQPKE